MKWTKWLRGCVVALAAMGIVFPQLALAVGPAAGSLAPAFSIHDIALRDDGSLRGQVVDAEGKGLGNVAVGAVQQGKIVASAKTDDSGHYAIRGLSSGVYHVATEEGFTVCRVWNAQAAPPSAQSAALVVNGDPVVRARMGERGGIIGFLSNPWVLGAIVAAAIAIPLALDDDDDGS